MERQMSYYSGDKSGTSGGMRHTYSHHGMVAEYQQSSIPWVKYYASASNQEVNFPYVTRYLIITSEESAKPVKLAFSSTGIANDVYVTIPAGTMSTRIEVKCKDIWITCTGKVSLLAGLTNVRSEDFPDITTLDGIKGA